MDLDYLFHRHRLSLTASTKAPSREARAAHRGLTSGYADRIANRDAAAVGSCSLRESVA